jgi:adenylate cyclase
MTDPEGENAWLEREDTSTVPVASSCSIGRAPTNQLVLVDEKVSRKHALIHRQGDHEYWLVDLGSSNGSYLDGRRVSQPVALRDGSIVRIGSSTLRFRQKAGPSHASVPSWAEGTIQDIRIAPCWLLLADIEGSTELSRGLPVDQLPVITGRWFSACKQAIEADGGMINKYLGDGFFAYWSAHSGAPLPVVNALAELKRLQAEGKPRFRVVLHYGEVSMGGAASMGEESLAGPEVNFVFRMEKLAGTLKRSNLMSDAAAARLSGHVRGEPAGGHALAGFEGQFAFFTF